MIAVLNVVRSRTKNGSCHFLLSCLPGGRELRRDAQHAALRQPRQEHHQQAHRQRGRQRAADPRAEGRDRPPQGPAGTGQPGRAS